MTHFQRWLSGVLLTTAVAAAACTGGGGSLDSSDADGGSSGSGSGDAGRFDTPSFATYPKDCTGAEDCVIVVPITQCGTCCGSAVSLRKGQPDKDVAAAEAACKEPGAPPTSACTMFCPARTPSCVNGVCAIAQVDAG